MGNSQTRNKNMIVAQSINLNEQKPWNCSNNNKNELNRQTQPEFEDKFLKFFQRGFKKQNALCSLNH